jgi:nitroreductase
MTTPARPRLDDALRRAAIAATLAPSVHNTQPWRFELHADALDVCADRTRQLSVLDPRGRQLAISVGCAVFNARVSLAADGWRPEVQVLPDAHQPDLLARLHAVPDPGAAADPVAAYRSLLERRQTNRREFRDDEVAADVLHAIEQAAAAEGAIAYVVTAETDRETVARLSRRADDLELLDPAYRAELRRWTTDNPDRRDGVPALAVPHVDGSAHDDIPIRDFDTRGTGWLPPQTHSSRRQCLVLLGTDADVPRSWLAAGQALERMLLEITGLGYVASPLTQAVEVAATRVELCRDLGLQMEPHILLRVGRAPIAPASRRRALRDVLV